MSSVGFLTLVLLTASLALKVGVAPSLRPATPPPSEGPVAAGASREGGRSRVEGIGLRGWREVVGPRELRVKGPIWWVLVGCRDGGRVMRVEDTLISWSRS